MLKRNSRLVTKAFGFYIVATILSSVAVQLGPVLDLAIVGNLLGKEALSAINYSMPAIQFMISFGMLINVGGAILVATEIGKGNFDRVRKIFSAAIAIDLIFGTIISICSLCFMDEIVSWLCGTESMRPMVKSYLQYVLGAAPIYLLSTASSNFLRVDSNPRMATGSLIIATVIHLILDFVLINQFSLGIAGSSIGMGIGFVVGILLCMTHFFRKSTLIFPARPIPFREWFGIIKIGMPLALFSFLLSLKLFCINHIVNAELGATGIAILAICFNILLLSGLFIGGFIQTLQPICSVMAGSHDNRGQNYAVRTTLISLSGCLLTLTLILVCFPLEFARLFGINEVASFNHIILAIRLFSLSIPLFGLNYIALGICQINRRENLAIMIAMVQSLAAIPVLLLLKDIGLAWLWSSFLIGEILTFLFIYCSRFSFFKELPGDNVFDCTLSNRTNDLEEFHRELPVFLTRNISSKNGSTPEIDQISHDIFAQLDTFSVSWSSMDILVRIEEKEVELVVRCDTKEIAEHACVLGQEFLSKNYERSDNSIM